MQCSGHVYLNHCFVDVPSMISTLPASVLCKAPFLCLHISNTTCQNFFINSDVHLLADHHDLICCQYCSCCMCHCIVSTPSRARFHPSLSWLCVLYAPGSCLSMWSPPVYHFLKHITIVICIIFPFLLLSSNCPSWLVPFPTGFVLMGVGILLCASCLCLLPHSMDT